MYRAARGLRTTACALVVLAAVSLAGCAKVDVELETRNLLDDAITKLTNHSADWQGVVRETLDKLPKEAQSLVRTELTDLLNRSIAAAGSEVRCVVDFLGQRVLQSLVRLRAQLLGQEVPPRQPTACSITPPQVRMADRNPDPNRVDSVQLHGYDFDGQPPLQVLLTDNNQVTDVTAGNLTRQTHYHMTLNLGANGIKLSPTSQLIALAWNGAVISQIPVIQPEQPPCPVERVHLDNIGTQEVRAALDRGDPEFGVNRPDVSVSVNLLNRESHVDADLFLLAVERNRGDTAGSGRRVFSIYSAPSGWRVLRIVTPTNDAVGPYHDTTWEVDEFPRAGNGPVSRFQVWGDTGGWDVEPGRSDGTRVLASFRRVELEIVKTVDCK